MATDLQPAPSPKIFNVPNQLSALRLVLAIAVFVLIPWKMYLAAFVVFVIAASTDWIDGYWARRFQQVTKFGRILDPFVDKIIICGTFIFLAAEKGSGIAAWMAVVVVDAGHFGVARRPDDDLLRPRIRVRRRKTSARLSGRFEPPALRNCR